MTIKRLMRQETMYPLPAQNSASNAHTKMMGMKLENVSPFDRTRITEGLYIISFDVSRIFKVKWRLMKGEINLSVFFFSRV